MSNEIDEEVSMSPNLSPDEDPKDSDESLQSEPLIVGDNVEESSSEGSEEENEDGIGNGYLPLAQDENESNQQHFISSSFIDDQSISESPGIIQHREESAPVSSHSQQMPQEQVDLIKKVMSGITLPSSSIPDWAKVVSEESWKAQLVSAISSKHEPEGTCEQNADQNLKEHK